MRFIVDECVGPAVAKWLREQGHDVYSVYEQSRGIDDDMLISIAIKEHRIIITSDKDFGEKVYREGSSHSGVILLRLDDLSASSKVAAVQRLLEKYPDRIGSSFTVVRERQVRFGKTPRLS